VLCDSFSLNACKLLSKLLSDAYSGLARPYQYFGWYGPGHTGHTASAAHGLSLLITNRAKLKFYNGRSSLATQKATAYEIMLGLNS